MSFCTNCGHPVSDENQFCTNCGTQVRKHEEPSPPHGISSETLNQSSLATERAGDVLDYGKRKTGGSSSFWVRTIILVSIAALVILVGVFVVKFRHPVRSSSQHNAVVSPEITRTRGLLQIYAMALEEFRADVGRYPDPRKELGLVSLERNVAGSVAWNGPYSMTGHLFQDGWGEPFVYYVTNGTPVLMSCGADRTPNTGDEIVAPPEFFHCHPDFIPLNLSRPSDSAPEDSFMDADSVLKTTAWSQEEADEKTIMLPGGVNLVLRAVPNRLWFGKYEVTQAQWVAVMGEKDFSSRDGYDLNGPNRPAVMISWDECQEFLKKLNALSSVKGSGLRFRLPTEKEWEFACRAGTKGKYCRLVDGTEINEYTLSQVAWFDKLLRVDGTIIQVGQLQPNAFGLYDMLGNAWEWTSTKSSDEWDEGIIRGGSWTSPAKYCTATYRSKASYQSVDTGFRLCADSSSNAINTAASDH